MSRLSTAISNLADSIVNSRSTDTVESELEEFAAALKEEILLEVPIYRAPILRGRCFNKGDC